MASRFDAADAPPGAAAVIARHVFYNASSFDGYDTGANAADDAAIAVDKGALLHGMSANFANVTSYAKGINGLIIDLANAPAVAVPSLADFDFGTAVRP